MRNKFTKLPTEYRWLPTVESLELYDGTPPHFEDRGYYYDEMPVPFSVTEGIDKRTAYQRHIHEETKPEWAPRGNTAHACLEAHLRGRSYDAGDYKDLVNHLVNHWIWDEWEAIGCEYRMFDKQRCIAGTADLILRNKKDPRRVAIGDLKTNKTKISKRDCSAQLGGYVNLLNLTWYELDVTDCFVVWACPTETDVDFDYDPMECLMTYEGIRQGFMKRKQEI